MRLLFRALVLLTVLSSRASALAEDVAPPPGLRDGTPGVHALVGARIVVAPGEVIEQGTLVIRDGVIAAVGADIAPPADARVWTLDGKTLYAGLIDAYSEIDAGDTDGGYWNRSVAPHVRVEDYYSPDVGLNQQLRGQGVTARLLAPGNRIIRGTSALVTTGDESASQAVLRAPVALHLRLQANRRDPRDGYPNSHMGAVALARQAFLDAAWYRQAWATYSAQPGLERPERSDALDALAGAVESGLPVMIDAPNELYCLRAESFAKEFNLTLLVRGSGQEYRRLDAIVAAGRPLVVPLNFPANPPVNNPEAAAAIDLQDLLHWDIAPENPARLAAAGAKITFTSDGLPDRGQLLAAVRTAVSRGLPADAALRALTVTPAETYGVADRLGTLAVGKSAHVLVADGDLFAAATRVMEVWIEGRRYENVRPPAIDLRGDWELAVTLPDGTSKAVTLHLEGDVNQPGGKLLADEKEAPFTSTGLEDVRFHGAFKGEPFGWAGVVRFDLTTSRDAASIETLVGTAVWADGVQTALAATIKPAEAPAAAAEQAAVEATPPRQALFPVNYPLGAFGVAAPPEQPAAILFRNATVWTCGPQGILVGASVLVQAGKIAAVGTDIALPAGAVEFDATGMHITPGIIDCHSHIATDGGINESGQTITAEVRIGDFINANDVNIYRQLAGGVTSINVLHGSANTIGGQNQVLKLRWGASPDEMRFAGAPPGIKFALGENVKQSNGPPSGRYPQTRMGVEQLVLDAFQAARGYQKRWERWNASPQGIPPRRDLELEALAEVLAGQRLVHCHSYRQDEILAFLRTCSAFGVRVGTLQHVLEGYKLADVMAQQGVGGSTFADWWAYKFEVWDAIPYNAALMHNAGVLVSLNSDYPELGRRLNNEAAKAVKYGNVPPAEALKMVTLNPARQLGIDAAVGSLEAGKEADFAVWNVSPLSSYARCEQTWIDGRKYFDRADDAQRRQQAQQMRAALIQRVLTGE